MTINWHVILNGETISGSIEVPDDVMSDPDDLRLQIIHDLEFKFPGAEIIIDD